MRRIIFGFVVMMGVWQEGSAILSPLNQELVEIKAIIDNPKLTELLGNGDVIYEIKKVENGYLILTQKHQLPIEIVYFPINRPGPAKFEIHFKNLKEIK